MRFAVEFKGQPVREIRNGEGRTESVVAPPATHSEQKRQAITRGLDFLQHLGEALFRNEQLASKHGADVLLPFYVPPMRAPASSEERHALRVATRLASEWRTRVTKTGWLPPRIPPAELLDLMQGAYSLECLGMGDSSLRAQLSDRSAGWSATDFFKYDPAAGEPPVARPRQLARPSVRAADGPQYR
jgi:hypothetical protein